MPVELGYAQSHPSAPPDPSYVASLGSCLRWDLERKESYLALPQHPELRLLPWREGLEDDMVEHFNEHDVGRRLYVLPYPFPRSYAEKMVSEGLKDPVHNHTLALLADRMARASLPAENGVNGEQSPQDHLQAPRIPLPTDTEGQEIDRGSDYLDFPFVCIYDTKRGKYVGKLGIDPWDWMHEKVQYTPEQVLAMPRPEQIWIIGYNLAPAYRGRGIMSEILGVLVESWMKPWMRVGALTAITEADNPASQAVMLKNGMRYVTSGQIWDWPVEKGGGTRETARYELRLR